MIDTLQMRTLIGMARPAPTITPAERAALDRLEEEVRYYGAHTAQGQELALALEMARRAIGGADAE